jgi:uncharacterized protein (DUF1330 family)
MSVYAMIQLTIHDRPRYDAYTSAFMPILEQYGGKLLVAQDSPQVMEGEWTGDRVVLLEFSDKKAFLTWATSPEYTEIAKDRRAGSNAVVLLARGVE